MSFDSPQQSSPEQPQTSWKDDWTMVVDLAVAFDQKGPHGHLGAEETMHDLEAQLAAMPKSTGGKDTARLFVGALAPAPAPAQPGELTTTAGVKYDFNVYKMQDGHLKLVSSAPTQGIESDLRKLTSLATPRFRDEKLGLIINAHGTPTAGYLSGETPGGATSHIGADAFQSIVHDWVNKDPLGFDKRTNGDRKLEFLDEEICFGSKLATINLDATIAKHLVASELVIHEADFPAIPDSPESALSGQNIGRIFGHIAQKPQLSGAELADLVIEDANAGANDVTWGGHKFASTPALGHYDLGLPRQQFVQSLDTLGAALASTLARSGPSARLQLGNVIDKIPDLWTDEGAPKPGNEPYASRDLKTFLAELKLAISDKRLADDDGKVGQAIDTLNSAQKKLIHNLHADILGAEWDRAQFIDPSKLGGLSVSLPDKSVRSDRSLSDEKYVQAVGSDVPDAQAPNWKKFLTMLRDQ